MGKVVLLIGLILVVVGLILIYAPWLVNWFGRLPGDIRYQGEHGGIFIPLTSMILVSVALSLLIRLVGRFLS